jgi:hypothetical protein
MRDLFVRVRVYVRVYGQTLTLARDRGAGGWRQKREAGGCLTHDALGFRVTSRMQVLWPHLRV